MIIDWPRPLVQDVARRRSVLFLGAGVSCQAANSAGANPKTWLQFLDAALAQVSAPKTFSKEVRGLISRGDLLTACEVIKRQLGKSSFTDLVRNEFQVPKFVPAPIHDTIISLDSRIVATPNFDKIFETHINHKQHGSVLVKLPHELDLADAVRGTQRVVIKVHGSIDSPDTLVFTRSDYAEARSKHHHFYEVLRSLAITHTFLFLGCGLSDPDINLLLEEHAFTHSFGRPHYFVLPKNQISRKWVQPVYRNSLNIEILEYDPRNHHELLEPSLRELGALVDAARVELQRDADW